MRFEVPQFIEVEDKIVGPFTWKQFVYLLGGAGATFILHVLLPFFLFLIVATPIVALTVGLAFYRHNNRPSSVLLESFFYYIRGARLYLWKKTPKAPTASAEASTDFYTPPAGGSSVASLSRKLEIDALEKK